jgi:GH15 family glucan-1,4-alpha-glucosidase
LRISDYALLSDCRSAALVGLDGSIDWFCVPRFDSPAMFGRLLDPDAGFWSLCPEGRFESSRTYLDRTMVVETRFQTPGGVMSVTDALALGEGTRGHDIGKRVPHAIVRTVRCLQGVVDVDTHVVPRFEYGLTHPRIEPHDGGLLLGGGPDELTLMATVPLTASGTSARARFHLSAGEQAAFVLDYHAAFHGPISTPLDPDATLADTIEGWRSWAALHEDYTGHDAERTRRSSFVLQALTYQPSGAVVAAPTTSLPERLGGSWNWDYRYAWLRDISLTMRALWIAACPHEANRFFYWVDRAGGLLERDGVQIVYGVEGERDLSEHVLPHLAGFGGNGPVRVGNDAWRQRQLDVLGEVIDAAYLLREQLGGFDELARDMLVAFADQAAANWRQPDSGMWEARGPERHYTSSKAMCWVALDRAVMLAAELHAEDRVAAWTRERDAVREAVLSGAWSEKAGAFAGTLGTDELDASVLQLPLTGLIDASDPRMRSTMDAIDRRLSDGVLVRRWAEEPNAFVICSYWMVQCLARAGEGEEARRRYDRLGLLANDVGLLSEELDPATGEALGNFPQAFSHVGQINAAWDITNLAVKSPMPMR